MPYDVALSGNPRWTAWKDTLENSLCTEKSAEELRNFTAWVSWVNAIEARFEFRRIPVLEGCLAGVVQGGNL